MERAVSVLQRRADGLGLREFVGGPTEGFEVSGRLQLIALIRRGLTPDSPVVDVGCGALRAGYWLIHFLDPGMYHGIEPAEERVTAARKSILEPGLEGAKRPSFSYNGDFDIGVFGVAPRFVLARSIWSHAAKLHIRQLLDSFAASAAEDALLLASYYPAPDPARRQARRSRFLGRAARLAARVAAIADTGTSRRAKRIHARGGREGRAQQTAWNMPDYLGEAWGGLDHPGGVVAHRFGWIADECRRRSLTARESPDDQFGHQVWIEVTRATIDVELARFAPCSRGEPAGTCQAG